MANQSSYKILVTALGKVDASYRYMKAEVLETTGLKQLSNAAAAASREFAALGATMSGVLGPLAGIGAGFGIFALVKGASDYGAQLYIASKKTGVAADALAKLHYVGETVNVDASEMDRALYRLNLTVQKSAAGMDKNAAGMFRGLHIPLKDAKGQLRDVTDILADLSDATQKHPHLAQLISSIAFTSKAGAAMIPVLAKGRAEIKALYDTFQKTYGKITPQIVRNAYEAHEAFGRLDLAASGLKFTLGSMLAPAMEWVTVGLTNMLIASREFLATGLPHWLSTQLQINRKDLDSFAGSFNNLAVAMGGAWDELHPLRDALLNFGNAIDPFNTIKYWPDWLKTATPALADFMRVFRGDTGAAARTSARAMNIGAALYRVAGEIAGGAEGKHPLNLQRLQKVWAGQPIKPGAVSNSGFRMKLDSTGNVYDVSKWFDFSSDKKSPLGIRLNNPGNLRSWGDTPTVSTASGRFAKFPSVEAGLSAAAGNLLAYKRHGWNTISQIISHWAPSSENNTRAYIGAISRALGVSPDASLDLSDKGTLQRLLTAIITREQGTNPYSQSLIASGVNARLGARAAVDVNVKIAGLPRGSTARAVKTADAPHLGDVGMGIAWANQ